MEKMDFIAFEEARKEVWSLGLKNRKDWDHYCKSNKRNPRIPTNPWVVYKENFEDLSDWLGNGKLPYKKDYLPFESSRDWARSKKIKTAKEWIGLTQTEDFPSNIRKDPTQYNDFTTWVDWLGNSNKSNFEKSEKMLDYQQSSEILQKFGFKSSSEFKKAAREGKLPEGIPTNPGRSYEDFQLRGGFPAWLGYVNPKKDYSTYTECFEYVSKLGLKSQPEFNSKYENGEIPEWIPKAPQMVFKDKGWTSWPDFLCNGYIPAHLRSYLSYEEASDFYVSAGISSYEQFKIFNKTNSIPRNIPKKPERIYSEIWDERGGWPGFLKTTNKSSQKDFQKKIGILRSILDKKVIEDLPPSILFVIIQQGALSARSIKRNSLNLAELVFTKPSSEERKSLIQKKKEEIESKISQDIDDQDSEENNQTNDFDKELGEVQKFEGSLPKEKQEFEFKDPEKAAKSLDEIKEVSEIIGQYSPDAEALEFISKYFRDRLIQFVSSGALSIQELQSGGYQGFSFEVIHEFLDEYKEAVKWLPFEFKEFIFHSQPTLEQIIKALRLIKDGFHIDATEPGGGKSLVIVLAFLIAQKKIGLIACPNSILRDWVEKLHTYLKDPKIFTLKKIEGVSENLYEVLHKENPTIHKNGACFFIVNYESFQQKDSEEKWKNISLANSFDLIALDELTYAKQENEKKFSRRSKIISNLLVNQRKNNKDLLVTGLSGTLLVNNLHETKKMIEMICGILFNEIPHVNSITNAFQWHRILHTYGTRFVPDYGLEIIRKTIKTDGTHLLHPISNLYKGDLPGVEKILIESKMNALIPHLKKGEKYLLYVDYVTDIIPIMSEILTKAGFTVGFYTGEDKNGLSLFKSGKIDILIGSSSISTGVDGLQKVCNKLVFVIPPWTSALKNQIEKRINRQGSTFSFVEIIQLEVEIQTSENSINWDNYRYARIDYKKQISNTVLDGEVPEGVLPSQEKLLGQLIQSAQDWIHRLENGDEFLITRMPIDEDFPESIIETEKKIIRSENLFREMNRNWGSMNSKNLNKRLSQNKEEWQEYHRHYTEIRKTWDEIPYEVIANIIYARKDWVIGDFGCGDNLLKDYLNGNKVYSFDHVAKDETVIACDMSSVPLQDEILDVAVFCLSLMGVNYKDYLLEALRVLKPFGRLFICEPLKQWGDIPESEIKEELESLGFKSVCKFKSNQKFMYIQAEKQ